MKLHPSSRAVPSSNALGTVDSTEINLGLGYRLVVQPVGPGSVNAAPNGTVYPPGTVVQLTAMPKAARKFIGKQAIGEMLEPLPPVLEHENA